MNYLVTGGTGYIGSYVTRRLAFDGEAVIAFDYQPDQNLLLQVMDGNALASVKVVKGDICDLDMLLRVCREHGVERIIHTAAVLSDDPVASVRVNCEGTVNVLECGRRIGARKVVLASSVQVFGSPENEQRDEVISNDAPHRPNTTYGACKSLNEACAAYYFLEHGLDAIAIRILEVYGWGRKNYPEASVQTNLFWKPALGIHGVVRNGDAYHNWMYVEDAALALVTASTVPQTRSRAFTPACCRHTTRETADCVRSIIGGASIELLPGKKSYPYSFDTTPSNEELGYRPEWSMERGITRLIENIRRFRR